MVHALPVRKRNEILALFKKGKRALADKLAYYIVDMGYENEDVQIEYSYSFNTNEDEPTYILYSSALSKIGRKGLFRIIRSILKKRGKTI